MENLISAVNSPDHKSCLKMSKAANLAGKAINISKTTAPHALSYILTSDFNIPHGLASALTLAEFLRYNGNFDEEELCDHRGISCFRKLLLKLVQLLEGQDIAFACQNLQDLMISIGVKTRLSQFGISSDSFTHIVKNVNLERLSNNPRKVTRDYLLEILSRIS